MNTNAKAVIFGASIVLSSCLFSGDKSDKKKTSMPLSGIYELSYQSLASLTNNRQSKNIPHWYAILDTMSYIRYVEFKGDSGYFIETDFEACQRSGYLQKGAIYKLVDSVLTIEEENDYGSFSAEYIAHKADSVECVL